MNFLFNDNVEEDLRCVLTYIDDFTASIGVPNIPISIPHLQGLLSGVRQDFPHTDGIDKASAFKKLAQFILFFVDMKPIAMPFPKSRIGSDLHDIDNHQNAIIAFQIAIAALKGTKIHRDDGDCTLKNPIELSRHSYVDIICALSWSQPQHHFKYLSLLLEQLAYKSNPDCQYKPIEL